MAAPLCFEVMQKSTVFTGQSCLLSGPMEKQVGTLLEKLREVRCQGRAGGSQLQEGTHRLQKSLVHSLGSLLAQVETSQPFPRHPTPRTLSQIWSPQGGESGRLCTAGPGAAASPGRAGLEVISTFGYLAL